MARVKPRHSVKDFTVSLRPIASPRYPTFSGRVPGVLSKSGGPCLEPSAQNPSPGRCNLSPAHASPDLFPLTVMVGDAEPHSEETGTEF